MVDEAELSLNLEELRTFVRVAALRSFGGAARELGLSPSAVSKQIRTLEERLGVRLLHRTTRRVSLSEAGELLQARAERLLEELGELQTTLRGLHGQPRGTLRISVPQDFGRLYLCGIAGRFAASYPELRIDVELGDRQVDLVEEGFDVVVRIARARDSTLVVRRIGLCERVLCASPTYLSRYGTPRHPSELSTHNCIEYGYLADDGWGFVTDGRRKTVQPTGRLRANSGWAMREMALADLGIALLPTFLVHHALSTSALTTLLDDTLDADLEVMALLPPGRQIPAKSRVFLDFLVDELTREPWWRAIDAT